jgi:hypothetical protein
MYSYHSISVLVVSKYLCVPMLVLAEMIHITYGLHEKATYFSPCHELIDRDVRKCEEGCQTEESEECYQPMGSLHPGTQES